ncbi:MAG: hypothetical protein K0U52_08630 [Gammaproteobacteria bacterium]|nr:hypothetical protein [Gammaproteobacteria bacterium]
MVVLKVTLEDVNAASLRASLAASLAASPAASLAVSPAVSLAASLAASPAARSAVQEKHDRVKVAVATLFRNVSPDT